MTLRADWEPKYCVELQSTSISTAGTFTGSAFGPAVGKCLIEALGEPQVDGGFSTLFNQKATGSPTDFKGTASSGEVHVGTSRPQMPFETDYNANLATVYLLLLAQAGISEAVGTPFVKTLAKTNYAAGASWWASILELLSKSTAGENKIINGAVLSQLTISGNSNDEVIRAAPQFMGGSFSESFDASSVDEDLSPDIDSLLFKNMVCELDNSAAEIDSFTFTLTNNLNSKPYNNASIQEHIFGRLQATGQIVIPRDCGVAAFNDNGFETKKQANTDFTLELYWGANPAVSNGQLAHSFNCHIENVTPFRVDGELCNQVDWRNVDSGSSDIGASWADSTDRGI